MLTFFDVYVNLFINKLDRFNLFILKLILFKEKQQK